MVANASNENDKMRHQATDIEVCGRGGSGSFGNVNAPLYQALAMPLFTSESQFRFPQSFRSCKMAAMILTKLSFSQSQWN